MPERKPGFLYIKSDLLKQEVAFSKKTGWLYCEDKYPDGNLVSYSPKEINLFADAGQVIDLATHTIKKIFGGEVVGITHSDGRDCGIVNNNKAGSGSSVTGNGEGDQDADFDIY